MDQGGYEQEDSGPFMNRKRDPDEPQSRADLEQHQKKIDHSEDQNDGSDFHLPSPFKGTREKKKNQKRRKMMATD